MKTAHALAAAALMAFSMAPPATAQMAHPPGMTHTQVVQAASAGGPAAISQNAAIAWIDSAGALHQMRPGTNGFTCVIVVPDPFGGPVCGDQAAAGWVLAMLSHEPKPPAMTVPGIAYMAGGGMHYEDAQGNVLMEHQLSPHTAGSHAVKEPPHWMLMSPYDPATSGLPAKVNTGGTWIMFAGTPWAHLMVYQDPKMLTAAANK